MAAVSQKCFAHLSPVFALSWGLRASRSDKTQVLLGLAAGIHTGMAVIDLFYAGMLLPRVFPPPPCCLIRSLLFWTQYQHRALVAHFCGGDKMAWKEDGSVPAASNRCCWQFVLSYIPWFISVEGKRNHFFSSLRKRGWVRWKLALSLRKYRTFCLSSWD